MDKLTAYSRSSLQTGQCGRKRDELFKQTAHLCGQSQTGNRGSSARRMFLLECRPNTASRPSYDCSATLKHRQRKHKIIMKNVSWLLFPKILSSR